MCVLLILSIFVFKIFFGLEKDNHRYVKDVSLNIIIILLTCFLLYYLSGLIIGFYTSNTLYSIKNIIRFIIPFIIIIILKEYLRYQILNKSQKSRFLIVFTCITFILIDVTNSLHFANSTKYQLFLLFALTILPAISRNITATYISYKVGYKPNIIWLIVVSLYSSLLPIVPATGDYIGSMISFLFPVLICYNVYQFFEKRKQNKPISRRSNLSWIGLVISTLFVVFIVYFTSGFFRYYTIAVATGSMQPNIKIGDVVIIDQKYPIEKLKVGQILAYKFENKIIVHRIVKIIISEGEYFIYTQGDANNSIDDYSISKDMVLGKVDKKIPYIGLPTVWLNDL
jgi:signal peptidase